MISDAERLGVLEKRTDTLEQRSATLESRQSMTDATMRQMVVVVGEMQLDMRRGNEKLDKLLEQVGQLLDLQPKAAP